MYTAIVINATAAKNHEINLDLRPRIYLEIINAMKNAIHAYDTGLTDQAVANRNVSIQKSDLNRPQPGQGNPINNISGQEALKKCTVIVW